MTEIFGSTTIVFCDLCHNDVQEDRCVKFPKTGISASLSGKYICIDHFSQKGVEKHIVLQEAITKITELFEENLKLKEQLMEEYKKSDLRIKPLNENLENLRNKNFQLEVEINQLSKELKNKKDLEVRVTKYVSEIIDLKSQLLKFNDEKEKLQHIVNYMDEKFEILLAIPELLKSQNREIDALDSAIMAQNKDQIEAITQQKTDIAGLKDEIETISINLLAEISKISEKADKQYTDFDKVLKEIHKVILNNSSITSFELHEKFKTLDKKVDDICEIVDDLLTDFRKEMIEKLESMGEPRSINPVKQETMQTLNEEKIELTVNKSHDKKGIILQTLISPKTVKEIINETGIGERTVYRILKSLLEQGKIQSDNGHPEKFVIIKNITF